jgi:hypothetical protein
LQTDHIYVPARFRMDFAMTVAALAPLNLHHEILIPNVLGMLANGTADVELFNARFLFNTDASEESSWQHAEAHAQMYLLPTGLIDSVFAIHAWKLSKPAGANAFWRWWTEVYSC